MSASEWLCIKEGDDLMYINVNSIRKIFMRDPEMTWQMQADDGHGGIEHYTVKLIKVGILTQEAGSDLEYHVHVDEHEAANLQQAMSGGVFDRVRLNVIDIEAKPDLRPAS